MATGYEVVHETITTGTLSDPPQQVDAPAGKFVVNILAGAQPTPAMPAFAELLLDGSDRVTGVSVLHFSVTQEVYLVCVDA